MSHDYSNLLCEYEAINFIQIIYDFPFSQASLFMKSN